MTTNRDIAARLEEMARYYEMFDVAWRPAAYDRAVESVAGFGTEAAALFAEGGRKALRCIPHVGPAIAEHVEEILKRGTFAELERYRRRVPVDLAGLTAVEGIGPKTVLALYRRLKITNVEQLERAARLGRIAKIPHFGKKAQANILATVKRRRHGSDRRILGYVLPLAERLIAAAERVPGVKRAMAAGSVRRRQETIGDLDILVAAEKPTKVMDALASLPDVSNVIERGDTLLSFRLKDGLRADFRVVPPAVWGAALQHFTGSKEHNVEIRKRAAAKGLKLNEYGLWRGKRHLAAATEEDVYRALGLGYIEPEIRTASGELEAAERGRLPRLIRYDEVRGDLQVQTDWTDGTASIEAMAEAAMALGREYIAVTDHTKALGMTGGLDEAELARQARAINKLNAKYATARKKFRLLKGAETNILKDGSIDINDAALAELDFVGASVHTAFKLPRAEQTTRIIKAMRNPNVDCIFHPTGRVINARDPYDLDMEAVLKAAKATGTAMEINAFPDRSDLRDVHVRLAVKLGVKLLIDTDAHAPEHLRYLDLGTAIARRGWTTSRDILNTRPLASLKKWLATPKGKRG